MGKQTDLILLDCSKALAKVEKLIRKIASSRYQRKWNKDFLDNRKQAVVINGINSDCIPSLESRRAQFSVWLFFLCTPMTRQSRPNQE